MTVSFVGSVDRRGTFSCCGLARSPRPGRGSAAGAVPRSGCLGRPGPCILRRYRLPGGRSEAPGRNLAEPSQGARRRGVSSRYVAGGARPRTTRCLAFGFMNSRVSSTLCVIGLPAWLQRRLSAPHCGPGARPQLDCFRHLAGPQAARADPDALYGPLHKDAHALEVGVELAGLDVVSVRDGMAEDRGLGADVTLPWHPKLLLEEHGSYQLEPLESKRFLRTR